MSSIPRLLLLVLFNLYSAKGSGQIHLLAVDSIPYEIYPSVNEVRPDLSSPFITVEGSEYVVAVTKEKKFAIIPVTLSNDREICKQLVVDTMDFPHLAEEGLHSHKQWDQVLTITGRSLDRINELGRPGGLSQAGFLAEDEDILSVLKADNRIVSKLGLTHPQLARPLFHVLNMMDWDLSLNRWNMSRHKWENIKYFYYHGQKVVVEAEDTKGGQQSIFNDGIEGGFYIKLWRELTSQELEFLKIHYGHLPQKEFNEFKQLLCEINTGEMEPQYIMRYGFYEGHTYWRTDPIAISLIFGLMSLEELDRIFDGELYKVVTNHFTP